ncbi:hypothetical protein C8J55DRAFT_556415 [Lentinula edodes]|uniref:Uncharacterized protein n=1 Tax=Lentinula lateritia TaxID=40482 RepID=A0A9W9AWG9_9AGAR|nr:hypothetical protein C8J55DRAFT_556415 [Lentinula edodes]
MVAEAEAAEGEVEVEVGVDVKAEADVHHQHHLRHHLLRLRCRSLGGSLPRPTTETKRDEAIPSGLSTTPHVAGAGVGQRLATSLTPEERRLGGVLALAVTGVDEFCGGSERKGKRNEALTI